MKMPFRRHRTLVESLLHDVKPAKRASARLPLAGQWSKAV
jgi:hypothetical protein